MNKCDYCDNESMGKMEGFDGNWIEYCGEHERQAHSESVFHRMPWGDVETAGAEVTSGICYPVAEISYVPAKDKTTERESGK